MLIRRSKFIFKYKKNQFHIKGYIDPVCSQNASVNDNGSGMIRIIYIYLKNKSWKPECVGSFNMDWRILLFYPEPEVFFFDLFRFWYVYEYKYGSIIWLEDGYLYLGLQNMLHTIYAAIFEQTIIHQHVYIYDGSQSNAPAHVVMRLYPIDKSLVCSQSGRRKSC
jgi:hypothetical protein